MNFLQINETDLKKFYQVLANYYGALNWWGQANTIERLVGMVLVQNTNWHNVELALNNFAKPITLDWLSEVDLPTLEEIVKPSGFFHAKAQTLSSVSKWIAQQKGISEVENNYTADDLRKKLLEFKGIGNETADVMLLFLFNKPSFVADKYAIRIFNRIFDQTFQTYPQLKRAIGQTFIKHLNVPELKDLHGMIDELAKDFCLAKNPKCQNCPMQNECFYFSHFYQKNEP